MNIRERLPEKIHKDSLLQVSQAMHNLGSSNDVLLVLGQLVIDNHLPLKALVENLTESKDTSFHYDNILHLDALIKPSTQVLLITEDGDLILVTGVCEENIIAESYFKKCHQEKTYTFSREDAFKDYGVLDTVLVIESGKPDITLPPNFITRRIHQHKKLYFSIISISIIIGILNISAPLGLQTFTDKVLPYAATNSLIVVSTLLILSAIASSVFQCFSDYQTSVLSAKFQNSLGKDVFQRLLAMNTQYFDQRKAGDLTKLIDQVDVMSNFLVHQLLSSIVSVVSLIAVLPLLIIYDAKLSAIVFSIGLLMSFTVGISLRTLRHRVRQAYEFDADYQSTLIEIIKGIRTIKSLANEPHFRFMANAKLEASLYGDFRIAQLRSILSALLQFQSKLITIAVLSFGAYSVFNGKMTVGQLIAFNMLANNVVTPLLSLVMSASGWETFKLAKKRLEELQPPEASPLKLNYNELDLNGPIEFHDVWFRYPENEPSDTTEFNTYVLRGINLTIQPNEIIGVVGGSGSGKSTLANLLLGFYKPTRGKIKINGFDIDMIPPEVLRARISSVQQTNFLFNTSVLQNVHLGRLSSSVNEIHAAVVASGSSDFVDEMPHKLLTPLSEDGGNLSGGQRQRLAIARALVRNSDILLFDEATSALDNQTEEKIKETIYHACQSKTGIIIAHRLNTLSYCDRIVVMKNGEIEAFGSHDELLTSENSYKDMWEAMLKRESVPYHGLLEPKPIVENSGAV